MPSPDLPAAWINAQRPRRDVATPQAVRWLPGHASGLPRAVSWLHCQPMELTAARTGSSGADSVSPYGLDRCAASPAGRSGSTDGAPPSRPCWRPSEGRALALSTDPLQRWLRAADFQLWIPRLPRLPNAVCSSSGCARPLTSGSISFAVCLELRRRRLRYQASSP